MSSTRKVRLVTAQPVAACTPLTKQPSVSTITSIFLSSRGTSIASALAPAKPMRAPKICLGHKCLWALLDSVKIAFKSGIAN